MNYLNGKADVGGNGFARTSLYKASGDNITGYIHNSLESDNNE